MNRLITRAALAALASLAAASAWADNPQPGQWRQQSALSADGQRWQALPERQSCLTAAQAGQSIEQTIQAMVSQAAQAGCRALELKAANGQAKGRFECQQPGAPALIDVQGSYAADRYQMTLVGTNLADRNGSGLVVPRLHMKHEGRYVGACAG